MQTPALQFLNPFLGLGGVPFPWAAMSPPSVVATGATSARRTPPSSPVSGTWHRPEPPRAAAAAFTIDAILGRCRAQQQHDGSSHLATSKTLADSRRGDRLLRSAPYSTLRSEESEHCGEGLHPPAPGVGCNPSVHGACSTSSGGGGGGGTGAGGKSKCKRVRTIFTAEQLERLEAEFARQQYMVGPERLYLAAALNLTEAQVKVWFQNRRIKWRKQYIEQHQAKLGAAFPHDPPAGAQVAVDSDGGDSGSTTEDESVAFEESYGIADESVTPSFIDKVPTNAFLNQPVSAPSSAAATTIVSSFETLIPTPWSARSSTHLLRLETNQGVHSPHVFPKALPGVSRSLLTNQDDHGQADQGQEESRTLCSLNSSGDDLSEASCLTLAEPRVTAPLET